MIKAYIKYWKKAGDLKSYSNRSDYWWVFLTNSIIFAILSILNFMVTIPKAGKIMSQSATLSQKEIIQQVTDLYTNPTGGALVIVIVTALIGLAILVPNISLTARRLRDARFPWWIALVFGVAAINLWAGYNVYSSRSSSKNGLFCWIYQFHYLYSLPFSNQIWH